MACCRQEKRRTSSPLARVLCGVAMGGLATIGCSAGGGVGSPGASTGGSDAGLGSGAGGADAGLGAAGSGGTMIVLPDSGSDSRAVPAPDPKTCAEAAQAKSYVGCDYWPTVIANNVWSIFDFAVVVANAGQDVAQVTVTRGGTTVATASVRPNAAAKLFLPWVPELKGPDADKCGHSVPLAQSVLSKGGAYHLVSTVPVTVYQFNALEFQGTGGPPNKDWSSCPGDQPCPSAGGLPVGCFSFSNDASLLLPSTALTGNYRVTGSPGASAMAPTIAVTAIQDSTKVTISLSKTAQIVAGTGVAAAPAGGQFTTTLNSGDVLEAVGAESTSSDFSGSLVQADKPVQVIAGVPCTTAPPNTPGYTCDHVEESVFPIETLGKHYFVAPPTAPNGTVVGHFVRFYGTVDNTKLTYPSGAPAGAPAMLSAGQVVDLNAKTAFEVTGDHEFAIGSFMPSAQVLNPLISLLAPTQGDPSASLVTAVEQYRTKYVFLAPDDYTTNYVDVVTPLNNSVIIDGVDVGGTATPIGRSSYGVARVKLNSALGGAHVLVASQAVGIQVLGYGIDTSYQYPGGLNLQLIAPPPPPPK